MNRQLFATVDPYVDCRPDPYNQETKGTIHARGDEVRISRSESRMVDRKTKVELDISYRVPPHSGIANYTLAVAQQLSLDETVELTLLGSGNDHPFLNGFARYRAITVLDRVRVRKGSIRVIPHSMRPCPVFGDSVVTVHDLIHLGPWSSFLKRITFHALLQLLKFQANVGLLAVSHYTRSQLIRRGFDPARVSVHHPRQPHSSPDRAEKITSKTSKIGGGQNPQRPRRHAAGLVLSYVGNLRPHKGVRFLLLAAARLSWSFADLTLHLVTSDDAGELCELWKDNACSDAWLVITANASNAERDHVIQTSAFYVAPSFDEGYGYGVDEAAHLGTSCIASAIPAHFEHAPVGTQYFAPGDVDSLVSVLASSIQGQGLVESDVAYGPDDIGDIADCIRRVVRASNSTSHGHKRDG